MRCAAVLFFALFAAMPIVAQHATGSPAPLTPAVLDLVAAKFIEPMDKAGLEARAMRLLLENLDPYSTYFDAAGWKMYETQFAGTFGGVGLVLEIDEARSVPRVRYVFIGSSAAGASLRRDDRITEIDGKELRGLPIDDVISMLRGEPGTIVELTLERDGAPAPFPVRLERRPVIVPSARGFTRDETGADVFFADADRRIGYIRILMLGEDTATWVANAIRSLNAGGMKSLVLDLRDCGGGKMLAARDIADMFLDGGGIVTTVTRSGRKVYDATPGVLTRVPMVLLVNDRTASSAEILTAALGDNGRATLIGQRTFGKGRVQDKIALPEGLGGVVISTGTFERPSGRTFDRHDAKDGSQAGIHPHAGMEVPLTPEQTEAWRQSIEHLDGAFVLTAEERERVIEDRVLARGIEVLAANVSGR